MEIVIIGVLLIVVFINNGTINKNKFIADNTEYMNMLKEEDYNFLVMAKYGENVDPEVLYRKRILNAIIVLFAVLLIFLGNMSILNIVFAGAAAYFYFKLPYMSLKRHYKAHLHQIDLLLPYYLKGLEILIQHYTVPVALARSINDAPELFQPGLRALIEKINSGDSSIDPYMDFANDYPVRDSMRMMRLLYRLGIGSQEKKQDRLMMFSRTVSNLQNKARETKYKDRLNKMEGQTMIMLGFTGGGVMLIILMSMMLMF